VRLRRTILLKNTLIPKLYIDIYDNFCYHCRMISDFRKTLYITGGWLCVILGFIGIFVPVLPTTSFLLLAAFLFTRSSKRTLHWLENNRLFGAYIRNYRAGYGMRMHDKVITLVMLWGGIGASIYFIQGPLWVELLLLVVAIAVTAHIALLKVYRPEA
jgi:uncharacterized protein